ncbi:tRNA1Val (adenine37-N6)-methyltransferase [Chitinophaga skermanii]|uniref:tRNA1(Val) (adenine(37)-N6)-methyltransferase n=1 Tax=Chitinophaga skermanii TaxID=331697 RepID=A0A327Q084_9BACT|nr:methyltransferase [Chitinophaga skermanii]RAI97865.1 tRNA1Val (adenine37-N6)-methyltransferase [Chitinophaga skermanii]
MGNQHFSFKQFTVHQDRCAMKVCTDACIQGAYTAQYLQNTPHIHRILDIGTGTGLLSLMLAQKSPAIIDAVELDINAYEQAKGNFAESPWNDRLHIIQSDIQALEAPNKYDFIITNPPFYEQALKSSDHLRNQAMHATTLSYKALLTAIDHNLLPNGEFSVLLPYEPFKDFLALATTMGFTLHNRLDVQQSPKHSYFRTVGIFSRNTHPQPITNTLIIKDEQNQYSPTFINLLKDYYLYL